MFSIHVGVALLAATVPSLQAPDTVGALAARCGSEIDFASDWEEAAALARTSGRHVLVTLRSYPGFDLPDMSRLVTFMDEDVIALVRARLVVVQISASSDSPLRDPAVYGLSPSTFGMAFLLVDADGTVLADTPHADPIVLHQWLRTELARHPDQQSVARPKDPVEAAAFALDRGELELADAALGEIESARAHRERARLHRLRRDAERALDELAAARSLSTDDAHAIACDQAALLHREHRDAEAAQVLAPVLADAASPHLAEALLQSSFIELRAGDAEAARALRERLMRDYPESRWAWGAAAFTKLEPLLTKAGIEYKAGWPRPEVLAVMREPLPEPLPSSAVLRAEADALVWLLTHQRADGSWPLPFELHRLDDEAPDLKSTAVDALATRALLQRGARYRAAAGRGLEFVLQADARRRSKPKAVVYMDYTAWAAWAQLELVADAIEAELGDAAALRVFGSRLVDDLQARVRRNGGWSYYVSGDLAGVNKVEQSISFTTAAAVIGLLRARDVGIEVPDALIGGGLDCLEAMRADDGLFSYMLHYPSGAQTRNAAPGAAGRGPACDLALHRGGRVGARRIRGSLALFDQNASALAAEVGKALMHAGADTQGCHYPFFDYLMAARAARTLSARDVKERRARMLDLVLAARLADGSFQDTPIIGPTFGTAAALLTMHALGRR